MEAKPITIEVGDKSLPVPSGSKEMAEALDRVDLYPGDGNLRLSDSNGTDAWETNYRVVAEAAVDAHRTWLLTVGVDQQIGEMGKALNDAMDDPNRKRGVIAKGKVLKLLRENLSSIVDAIEGKLGAKIDFRIKRQWLDPVFEVYIVYYFTGGDGFGETILLSPTYDAEALEAKMYVAHGGRHTPPGLRKFIENHLEADDSLSDEQDRRRDWYRDELRNIVFKSGLSKKKVGLFDRYGENNVASDITRIHYDEDRGVLIVEADGRGKRGFAGSVEYSISDVGGAEVLSGRAKSARGEQEERALIFRDGSWEVVE